MKRFTISVLLSLITLSVFSQVPAQTIRGQILEKNTHEPLVGVSIIITYNNTNQGTTTNIDGNFEFKNIPVGRCNVKASMIGFLPYTANSILVYSGKETVLEIFIEESIIELKEVVVTPTIDKENPLNDMAAVSARMLSNEEADRYAGSWGDPARMVSNFAGVVVADDSRNDIVIRGNSPMGLLWKLDGFEIPNPNHFGAMGATGGPIGMINNNQLTNSDFYTGAFPAEYGNATSGVFDLNLRNGNRNKYEFMGAMGFNGFEAGAEGPLSKNKNASFMINGRYSFLEILNAVGFNVAGGAIPEYQDLTAKVNIPLKTGNLSMIALLGASQIHMKPEADGAWEVGDEEMDMLLKNKQYFFGMNYTKRFNTALRLENRLSYQFFESKTLLDRLVRPNTETESFFNGFTSEGRVDFTPTLHYRINNKNILQTGAGINYYMTKLKNTYLGDGIPHIIHDSKENSSLVKAYIQWQHRFSDRLSIIPGVYSQYYLYDIK